MPEATVVLCDGPHRLYARAVAVGADELVFDLGGVRALVDVATGAVHTSEGVRYQLAPLAPAEAR